MRKIAKLTMAVALGLGATAALGKVSDGVVKIGVLNDMSGVYSASSGPGTLAAVKMAVDDFGGKVLDQPIQVVSADHQNKPDIGAATARKWFDVDKVDMIADVPGSAIALAIQDIAKEKNRVFMIGGAGAAELTGKSCSPNSVHYVYDTYSLANTAGKAAVEKVGDTFYFLTVDYAFGQALEGALTNFVTKAGGKVVGGVKHPLGVADFSSFILQAQSSGAKVVALANAAGDTVAAIKAAKEFGLEESGQKLLALLIMDPDIQGIGLDQAQGLLLATPFVWNRTAESTAWSRRYFEKTGAMPSMMQAGAYSYTMHYLNAVKSAGTDEAQAVVRAMKDTPVDDFFAKGVVREDGRFVHDMYLVEVKTPKESTEPWDFFKVLQTIPGDQAFRPMKDGGCAFVDQAS